MKKRRGLPKSTAKTAWQLLKEIRKLILEEPMRYDQTAWLDESGPLGSPACGTVGCVAGWVAVLRSDYDPDTPDRLDIMDEAQMVLGLNSDQATMLFSGYAADGEAQTEEHAVSGAEHIKDFMHRYEDQLRAHKLPPIVKQKRRSGR